MIARPLAALTLAPSAPTPTSAAVTAAEARASWRRRRAGAAAPVSPVAITQRSSTRSATSPHGRSVKSIPIPIAREHDAGLASGAARTPTSASDRARAARPTRRRSSPARASRPRARPSDSARLTRLERTWLGVRHRDVSSRTRPGRESSSKSRPGARNVRAGRARCQTPGRGSKGQASQRARSSFVLRISFASGPRFSGPAVSSTAGRPCRRGLDEEHAELLAELALEDVRVPVAVRAERGGGVVDVQRAQPVEADRRVELVEAARRARPGRSRRRRTPRGGTSRGRCRAAGAGRAARRSSRARRSSGRSCRRRRPSSPSAARSSSEQQLEHLLHRRARRARARPRSPLPRCEPTWKTTPSAPIAQATSIVLRIAATRLLVDRRRRARRGCRGRARGRATPPIPASARRSRKRSKLAGSWFVGRHVRGLWVKTCTESASSSTRRGRSPCRSRPRRRCARRCCISPKPGLQPGRLVLDLAPRGARQRRERRERSTFPFLICRPGRSDEAVDEERSARRRRSCRSRAGESRPRSHASGRRSRAGRCPTSAGTGRERVRRRPGSGARGTS